MPRAAITTTEPGLSREMHQSQSEEAEPSGSASCRDEGKGNKYLAAGMVIRPMAVPEWGIRRRP